jgi:hypothetical protein
LDDTEASNEEEGEAEAEFRVNMIHECFPGFGKPYIKEWLFRHNGNCKITCDHLAKLSPPGESPEPLTPSHISQVADKEASEEESISILHECFPGFNKAYIKGYVDRYNGDWAEVTSHLSKMTEPEFLPEPSHLGGPPSIAEENRRQLRALHEDFPDFEQWYLEEWRAHYNGYCHLERASLPKLLCKKQYPEGDSPGEAHKAVETSTLRPVRVRSIRRLEACQRQDTLGTVHQELSISVDASWKILQAITETDEVGGSCPLLYPYWNPELCDAPGWDVIEELAEPAPTAWEMMPWRKGCCWNCKTKGHWARDTIICPGAWGPTNEVVEPKTVSGVNGFCHLERTPLPSLLSDIDKLAGTATGAIATLITKDSIDMPVIMEQQELEDRAVTQDQDATDAIDVPVTLEQQELADGADTQAKPEVGSVLWIWGIATKVPAEGLCPGCHPN